MVFGILVVVLGAAFGSCDGNTTEDIECRTSLFFDYSRGCVPMRNTAPTRNR